MITYRHGRSAVGEIGVCLHCNLVGLPPLDRPSGGKPSDRMSQQFNTPFQIPHRFNSFRLRFSIYGAAYGHPVFDPQLYSPAKIQGQIYKYSITPHDFHLFSDLTVRNNRASLCQRRYSCLFNALGCSMIGIVYASQGRTCTVSKTPVFYYYIRIASRRCSPRV